ncbi:MAG TPA: Flp family type IVb pilin [Candidatus Acidoferrum sp.]|nr:Flp family type IVb pilin [Candidatus Acidoferrum sp.]
MLTALKTFAQDESGATAIEFGLLTGLLAIGVTMSLSVLGGSVEEVFAKVSTEVLSTVPGAGVQIVTPDPV